MSEKIDSPELEKEKEKEVEIPEVDEVIDDYHIAKKLIQLKQSADSRKIPFSLKFTTVKKLLNAKVCFYTGKPFDKKGLQARSIDRVDSSKGYVDDNVVACTVDVNIKKTNLTVEEILLIAKKVNMHLTKKKK